MQKEFTSSDGATPDYRWMGPPGSPKNIKKRVLVGVLIGVGIILCAMITFFVLREEGEEQKEIVVTYPHYNPYYVQSALKNGRKSLISLVNKRKELEKDPDEERESHHVPIINDTSDNRELQIVEVLIDEYDEQITHFTYKDPNNARWVVPYYREFSGPQDTPIPDPDQATGFELVRDVNSSFQWYYHTIGENPVRLLSTKDCRLQYFDKYVEFEVSIETSAIYGITDGTTGFHLKDGNHSLWNSFTPHGQQRPDSEKLYGSHPFFLSRINSKDSKYFIGLFMRNSNYMTLSNYDAGIRKTIVNYKMAGGIIDLYLFYATDPQHILIKYQSVIGKPYLPPIWSLGLQQARADYTVKDFETIIERHSQLQLPIDALWGDMNMNDGYRAFTVDKESFGDILSLVKKMHDSKGGINMNFVPIANPGLKKDADYKHYLKALKSDVLIKSAANYDHPFEGFTIAGPTVWVDFFMYEGLVAWAMGLLDYHDITQFDGIWITDNEIYNLCNGECQRSRVDTNDVIGIPDPFHNASEFDSVPYNLTKKTLEINTLPMAAYHSGDDLHHKQFNTHNLFSLQVAKATYNSLRGIFEDKKFLIASRSTWPGSGQYSSHWLNDNQATWESMLESIPGILNYNMFGIPHVGAPIGGFHDNCDDELLTRWFELGAFYPLMLSYSSANANRKEAFASMVAYSKIREVLQLRYSLIMFMFTKMFEVSLWGGAVVHPLFFAFPNDTKTYTQLFLERTFMWSDTLYILPVLYPGVNTVREYLPNWRWYNLRTLDMVTEYISYSNEGHYIQFEAPLGSPVVLIKGGRILPYQPESPELVATTKDLYRVPLQFIVAIDHNGMASGSLIIDSGGPPPHPDPAPWGHRYYSLTYKNKTLKINETTKSIFTPNNVELFTKLTILGESDVFDITRAYLITTNSVQRKLNFTVNKKTRTITLIDENTKKLPLHEIDSIIWESKQGESKASMMKMKVSDQEQVLENTSGAEKERRPKFNLKRSATNHNSK